MKLPELAAGDKARITGFNSCGQAFRWRLLTMGLTPHTPLTVVRRAPLGDPIQIDVRGSSLSLRKMDAEALIVEKV